MVIDIFAGIPDEPGVYVLRLRRDKYYVGYSVNLRDRIRSHFDGDGAAWTRVHPPCDVHQIHEGKTEVDEQIITLQMMQEFGWEQVRGGRYCQVKMPAPPPEFVKGPVCFGCQGPHFIRDCPNRAAKAKEDGRSDREKILDIIREVHGPEVLGEGKGKRKASVVEEEDSGIHANGEEEPPLEDHRRRRKRGIITISPTDDANEDSSSSSSSRPHGPPPPPRKKAKIVCYRCGNVGHMQTDCNVYSEDEEDEDGSVTSGEEDPDADYEPLECSYCGGPDHWEWECKKKKRDANREERKRKK